VGEKRGEFAIRWCVVVAAFLAPPPRRGFPEFLRPERFLALGGVITPHLGGFLRGPFFLRALPPVVGFFFGKLPPK